MLRRLSAVVLAVSACAEPAPEEAASPVRRLAVWDESAWQAIDVEAPSSAHPYANYAWESWDVVAPHCAEAVRLRFDRIELEADYDYLFIDDTDYDPVQTITGYYDGFVTEPIGGNTAHLFLYTDGSVTDFGFAVTGVEAVAGPVVCPRAAIMSCPDGTVDATPRPGMCECESIGRDCRPADAFAASLVTTGGFTGGGGGFRLKGSGEVYEERYEPSGYHSTHVATARPAQVRELAAWLFYNGYFQEEGVSGEVDNLTSTFGASYDDSSRAFRFPAGDVGTLLPLWAEAVRMFEKTVACDAGGGEYGSTCVGDRVCVDGVCLEAALSPCAAVLCEAGSTCVVVDGAPLCQARTHCGGIAAFPCPGAGSCAEDPSDDCDPAAGGADCGGICLCEVAGVCADGFAWDASPAVCGCAPATPDSDGCFCTKEYNPVCGVDGGTYGNACEAGCAEVDIAYAGECGGCSATRPCDDESVCRYAESTFEPPYTGAEGSCVADGYCDAVSDCDRYPHILCVGSWSCVANSCAYACGPFGSAWESWAASFGTDSPYANDEVLGWELSVPGATALRVVFETFSTEAGYDFVTLYDAAWNEVASYSGERGAFFSDEVAGETAYLVFNSDATVVDTGFVAGAVEYLLP